MSIRVIIAGFKGKMGQAACQMVLADPALDLVAVIDPSDKVDSWQGVPVYNDKETLIGISADVWVDLQLQQLLMRIHALLLKMALLQ